MSTSTDILERVDVDLDSEVVCEWIDCIAGEEPAAFIVIMHCKCVSKSCLTGVACMEHIKKFRGFRCTCGIVVKTKNFEVRPI